MAIKGFISCKAVNALRATVFKKLAIKVHSLCIIAGLCIVTPLSLASSFSDHQIKAVFLFNFANFVNWPEEAFEKKSSPFIFCASNAQSPTIKTLSEVIKNEKINNHNLIIKAPFDQAQLSDCHILFLEEADIAQYQSQLPGISAGSTLTVSDTPQFVDSGGLVELVLENARIRPKVNIIQLAKSKIKMNATLLRLVTIYRPATDGGNP